MNRIRRKKSKGDPMSEAVRGANAARSKIRARIEYVFAEQKDHMGLFIRTGQGQVRGDNRPRQHDLQYEAMVLARQDKCVPTTAKEAKTHAGRHKHRNRWTSRQKQRSDTAIPLQKSQIGPVPEVTSYAPPCSVRTEAQFIPLSSGEVPRGPIDVMSSL
ncbi:hypothetical protein [Labrys sp. 22185]|uniref:hypothetical protein n=1 Tax=Labrys sp. 22185 TaxID=3453888 RepID=UPI003F865395